MEAGFWEIVDGLLEKATPLGFKNSLSAFFSVYR